jgi:trans-2-enoyl-CoA reductase
MTEINTYFSILTLSVYGLSAPINRHRLAGRSQKSRLKCLLPENECILLGKNKNKQTKNKIKQNQNQPDY